MNLDHAQVLVRVDARDHEFMIRAHVDLEPVHPRRKVHQDLSARVGLAAQLVIDRAIPDARVRQDVLVVQEEDRDHGIRPGRTPMGGWVNESTPWYDVRIQQGMKWRDGVTSRDRSA